MKRLITMLVLCTVLAGAMMPAAMAAGGSNYSSCMAMISEQRDIQAQAHQTANRLRAQGYTDKSAYIQAAKSTWNEAQANIAAYQKLSRYTDEEIRILATTVYYEAGCTTDQLRHYVAQVVMNRVADSRFPNTVRAVIEQPGQYAGSYTTAQKTQAILDADARNGTYYYAMCEAAAKDAMMGRVDMPSNVVFQANFRQGSGVWKSVTIDTGYFRSTSYFCY